MQKKISTLIGIIIIIIAAVILVSGVFTYQYFATKTKSLVQTRQTQNSAPTILVTSPNSGQSFPFGNTMVIPVSWSITNTPVQYGINLIILNSSGSKVGTIGGILTNPETNNYNWGYALQPGQYKIKAQVCTIGAVEEAGPTCGSVLAENTGAYFTVAKTRQ